MSDPELRNKSGNMSRGPFTREEMNVHQTPLERLTHPEKTQYLKAATTILEALFEITLKRLPTAPTTREDQQRYLETSAYAESLSAMIMVTRNAQRDLGYLGPNKALIDSLRYLRKVRSNSEPLDSDDLTALQEIQVIADTIQGLKNSGASVYRITSVLFPEQRTESPTVSEKQHIASNYVTVIDHDPMVDVFRMSEEQVAIYVSLIIPIMAALSQAERPAPDSDTDSPEYQHAVTVSSTIAESASKLRTSAVYPHENESDVRFVQKMELGTAIELLRALYFAGENIADSTVVNMLHNRVKETN